MRHFMLVSVFATLAAFGCAGQNLPPGPPMEGMGGGGPHGPGRFGGPGFGPHPGKVITGKPYSATVTNTSVEQLADGNTIQRTTTGEVARDTEGRTYERQTITGGPVAAEGPVTLTFISDPVAGYVYTLNSKKQTAMRRAIKTPASNADASGSPAPRFRPDHARAQDSAQVSDSDLGSDSSSGVAAAGKKTTRVVPANTIGNSQPITSTSERWYSSDLQLVVKAVRTDPRFGQSTYTLTNIAAKEPDASLFKVPSAYTIEDAPQHPHQQ